MQNHQVGQVPVEQIYSSRTDCKWTPVEIVARSGTSIVIMIFSDDGFLHQQIKQSKGFTKYHRTIRFGQNQRLESKIKVSPVSLNSINLNLPLSTEIRRDYGHQSLPSLGIAFLDGLLIE